MIEACIFIHVLQTNCLTKAIWLQFWGN